MDQRCPPTRVGKAPDKPCVLPSIARQNSDACLPRQDHVYTATDESLRFHNNKFDEMPCKLDSTENLRPFEKYPTQEIALSKIQVIF